MPRLLVIDDRDQTIEMCQRHLPQFDYVTRCDRQIPCQVCEERDRGCKLKCAHDYAEAAEVLARPGALPDLVVLDLHFALPEDRLLPEDKSDLPAAAPARRAALEDLRRRQGLLILDKLRARYPALPVVMLTTTDTELPERSAADPLLYFCENEVVDSRSLAAEVTHALELRHEVQEGPVFWGRSPAMAALRRALGTLARSPLPILLEGPTGSGKSFLAERYIHPVSGVKGPLVVSDLSTIPTTLLPSHLFGARRGSYTGSVEDQAGVFEQAHGGTLFLDEIGSLDLDLQRQLLLVLERGSVTRLGDTRARPAAPRLVAATNEDLERRVAEGRFRADLYSRLNPATRLRVPALVERREDLPDLVRFAFLEALASEPLRPLVRSFLARFPTPDAFDDARSTVVFGKPSAAGAAGGAFTVFLSRHALGRLGAHAWPGNLRELRLFAANALVFTLVDAIDGRDEGAGAKRAPAILAIADRLVDRLLPASAPPVQTEGTTPTVPGSGRRVGVWLRPGPSFAKISIEVERQYLEAMFRELDGDLERIAGELLGPTGTARQVHLRLNQLGVRVRELRRGK